MFSKTTYQKADCQLQKQPYPCMETSLVSIIIHQTRLIKCKRGIFLKCTSICFVSQLVLGITFTFVTLNIGPRTCFKFAQTLHISKIMLAQTIVAKIMFCFKSQNTLVILKFQSKHAFGKNISLWSSVDLLDF